jgi:hypothetical protein
MPVSVMCWIGTEVLVEPVAMIRSLAGGKDACCDEDQCTNGRECFSFGEISFHLSGEVLDFFIVRVNNGGIA